MYLTQIPFYPANRAIYDYAKTKPAPEEVFKLYPELFRCVACNSCTKVCPMDVEVMDAVAQLKRGDIARAAEMSIQSVSSAGCVPAGAWANCRSTTSSS